MPLYNLNRPFYKSNASVASTNTTGEELLTSVLIPAGTLGNNDTIEVRGVWDISGRAGTVTLRVRLHTSAAAGGTAYYAQSGLATTQLSARAWFFIEELNATNSQNAFAPNNNTFQGGLNVALATSALSTASDMYVIFSSQKNTGTDPTSLKTAYVNIIRK